VINIVKFIKVFSFPQTYLGKTMDKKALLKAFALTAIFMLGMLASSIYAKINIEKPLAIEGKTDKIASPSDWIEEKNIGVYSKQVILDIKEAEWATFTDTHSMEPVISARSNAIEIVPKSPEDIGVGDIVSYKSEYADGIIIHRVIEKGIDNQGVYFILKGDNNPEKDPGKIRFSQIKRVVVAIIY
jgi:signal peptidase I